MKRKYPISHVRLIPRAPRPFDQLAVSSESNRSKEKKKHG